MNKKLRQPIKESVVLTLLNFNLEEAANDKNGNKQTVPKSNMVLNEHYNTLICQESIREYDLEKGTINGCVYYPPFSVFLSPEHCTDKEKVNNMCLKEFDKVLLNLKYLQRCMEVAADEKSIDYATIMGYLYRINKVSIDGIGKMHSILAKHQVKYIEDLQEEKEEQFLSTSKILENLKKKLRVER